MFCTNCGCENNDSSKFCKQCGTRLETLIAEEKPEVTKPETEETKAAETEVTEPEITTPESEVTEPETAETAPAGTETAAGTTAAEDPASATQTQAETPQAPPAPAFTAQNAASPLSGLGEMLKLGITSPLKGIAAANKPANWLSGLLIFIVTDVIIALLITVAVSAVVTYVAGGILRIAGLDLSMSGYSPGAVFVTAFLLLLFSDVLEIFIIFGMGKAFGSKATLKSWIAVCATSQILFRLLSIVALLLMMLGAGGLTIGMVLISIGALSYLILMFKAFEVSTELENNKLFYGFICAYLVFIIAFSIVTGVITAINASMAYNNTFEPYNNNFFDNNSF